MDLNKFLPQFIVSSWEKYSIDDPKRDIILVQKRLFVLPFGYSFESKKSLIFFKDFNNLLFKGIRNEELKSIEIINYNN